MLGIQKEADGPGHDPGATLFAQAQAGCTESLKELMQRHEGLVYRVVQRQWLLTLPYEEALQAGRWGLWRAIMSYDPEQGTTFGTYAYKERVRQLRNEALVWMGQPAHSQSLRSLLARHTQQQYELADHLAQIWLKRRGGRNGRI
jgi:DNA-directed RNA polymerase specialized sigma subunit